MNQGRMKGPLPSQRPAPSANTGEENTPLRRGPLGSAPSQAGPQAGYSSSIILS